MALELDTRQRAMLQEMGVHVWLPEAGVVTLEAVAIAPAARMPIAHAAPAMPPRKPQMAAAAAQPANPAPGPVAAPSTPAATVSATSFTASLDWSALTETVAACQVCTLCAGRSHATLAAPADDTIGCDWMVVGDPPDEDEDQAGAPFAGQDGVLLANMLRALGLQRANPLVPAGAAPRGTAASAAQRAYVTNVLKCRPAHGAVPQATELAQCSAWLQREIALVKPKLIVSVGRFANQVLLGETPALAALPLGKLRGTVHRYQGVAVVVSYPPKLLMRNSADKAKAWADLCLAAAAMQA